MASKIPPPPPIASNDPTFNRWLLELTSILNNSGGIDPSQVTGLLAIIAQVAIDTAAIAALQGSVAGQGGSIAVLQGQVTVLQGQVVAINSTLTTLSARAQVLNGTVDPANGLGNVNDWYANTMGVAGHRIFIKTGVATWTAFPF